MKYTLAIYGSFLCIAILLFSVPFSFVEETSPSAYDAQMQTSGAGLLSKVAPGEALPISMKLLNFGSRKRVDATVTYEIVNRRGNTIYAAEETVAVETTASFVKTIQIPEETLPGTFMAKTSIVYPGQLAPVESSFPFKVERKIAGLFQSDFYRYGAMALVLSLMTGFLSHVLVRKQHTHRLDPHDYADVPEEKRIFYEMISDMLMEMRYRIGNRALEIGKQVDHLVIDENTGKVLDLKADPADIVADLIRLYEKASRARKTS